MTDSRNAELRGRLHRFARNLWWTFRPESQGLFRDLAPERWEQVNHDPMAMLRAMDDEELGRRAERAGIHARLDEQERLLSEYLASEETWGDREAFLLGPAPVAYFSAEFGLHESIPIYSGGLGVLAGDHLKSASDLGLPLVGVGLFYGHGYFTQRFDHNGWQQEDYPRLDPRDMPLVPALGADEKQIVVRVRTREREIAARVWEARVGRVRLLLLDSDVDGNADQDRALTARLYGGDSAMRIHQELILGVGGAKALAAAGIHPLVIHMNEGHSAFAGLEMVRHRMEREGLSFAEARHQVASRAVFTTHTPVPAGHDRFHPGLVERCLGPLRDALGLTEHQLLALGRENPDDIEEQFCMTVLAASLAHRINGVSALHGRVSRAMWRGLWPARARDDVPIGHITNGVHLPTWLSTPMARLLDAHLPRGWRDRQRDPSVWAPVRGISDENLRAVRRSLRAELAAHVRRTASAQAAARGEPQEVVEALYRALPDRALLVGFARRFATYKRASLVLRDPDALDALVNHPEWPVCLVFAGKAHPADEGGKRLIAEIHAVSRDPRFLGKVVLLEGYDMGLGRALTSGVDVWLNNPRRPLEASGTSGQKVVLNGGLHCSILDGWWAEAYDGKNGFALGGHEVHADPSVQDARDSDLVLATLRDEVAPAFFADGPEGPSGAWLRRVRRSLVTLGPRFNADRMVQDYALGSYLPAAGGILADPRGA